MAKKPKSSKSEPSTSEVIAEVKFWRRHLIKICLAVFAASLSAVWQVYQNWLSSAIEHHVTAIWAEVFDKPMPEGSIVRLDLRFGLNENADAERYERMRVTLWPGRCKREGGDTLTRTFDRSNSQQNVILQVKCNYKGHIKITLTPVFGETATIYEGLPTHQEVYPFAGVPGSYHLGQVQITRMLRDTSWVPVNKCQLMSSCDEFDPDFPD
ncbi:TPA: hypothetical protein QDZ23_002049 [Pseudomonas putida]|nr:hypothetical protein [Pseudomonas putida]